MRRTLLHWSTVTAWLAVVWSLVAAGWHAAWALGATVGLPAGAAARDGGGPLLEDVATTVALVAVAALALCLATGARGRAGAVVWTLARLVGVFLVLRGVGGFVALGWSAAGTPSGAASAWQLAFVLGGLLLLGAAPKAGVPARRAPHSHRTAVRAR